MRALKLTAAAILGSASLAAAAPVTYQLPPETATLRPGPGVEVAQNNCMACHSVDYIAIQPPKKGKAFWEAEVVKMIKTYKAQINDEDAKAIADYLASTY
jgi:sulfite dehydrogenase (cytochrome) subunit B